MRQRIINWYQMVNVLNLKKAKVRVAFTKRSEALVGELINFLGY